MSKKRKGSKTPRRRIDHYQRNKKKLQPVLASYPRLQPIDYHATILPQLLWIEALIDFHGEDGVVGVAHSFLDLFEGEYTCGDAPVSGLVESFGLVPEGLRERFVQSNRRIIELAVLRPFASALCLYDECPMRWMLDLSADEAPQFDIESALASLKRWTANLIDRCGEHSNLARALVFARYVKAGKVILRDREFVEELRKYPACDNRRTTESRIRAMSNAVFVDFWATCAWGRSFWAKNGRISMCTTESGDEADGEPPAPVDGLTSLVTEYEKGARAFLAAIEADFKKCLPDTSTFEKPSVLSGLLARATALAVDLLTESSLWVAEIGSILLRCLCESLILMAWLVEKNDDALYAKYVQYSLGQLDLHGLKLEGYEGYREAFRRLYAGAEQEAEALTKDSWDAQLRSIELGSWADTNTRIMAEEAKVKVYYDLVFALSSADVHSQFISLARWNMVPCTNPLHNFHLIPAFGCRVVNPFLPLTGCVLLKEACIRFFRHYSVTPACTAVLDGILAKGAEQSDRLLPESEPEPKPGAGSAGAEDS